MAYNSAADVTVAYQSPYSQARSAALNSATVAGGNAAEDADGNPLVVNGGNPPAEDKPTLTEEGEQTKKRRKSKPKEFTCTDKHPIGALKQLCPDAKFETICKYLTSNGAAIVVTTTVKGVVYQGEGSSSKIAQVIAAQKALVGMDAADHDKLLINVDLAEQKDLVMKRITLWQEEQNMKNEKKVAKEKRMEEIRAAYGQPVVKKIKGNDGEAKPAGFTYGTLIQTYGPDIINDTVQIQEEGSIVPKFKCTLTVQGFVFEAIAGNKKEARNNAVALAHTQFLETPPPFVHEKTTVRKTTVRKKKKPARPRTFTPFEPTEFQDLVAKKCWDFVTEQTASIPDNYKPRRNLVAIVKVEGEDSIDNCEIVAFGSGTIVIKKEDMTSDGTRINDSSGESLALRALRRYLLDEVEKCLGNRNSIYGKDKSGKCTLKKGVKLYMYSNGAPMGDCRAYNPTLDEEPEAMETDKSAAAPAETDVVKPEPLEGTEAPKKPPYRRNFRWRKPRITEVDDLGKIQMFVATPDDKAEVVELYSENSHCIVSPSDKLAIRQMCGVQGSVLFSLSNPVYISNYLIDRSFNDKQMMRALYTRVNGAKVSPQYVGPEPTLTKVKWRATYWPDNKSPWSLIWAQGHAAEVISAVNGLQHHPKEGAEDQSSVTVDDLTQSEYCTKALYSAFMNVCRKSKKTYLQKYSVAKYANTRYRQVKNAILAHIKETGMGEWPERLCKPEF